MNHKSAIWVLAAALISLPGHFSPVFGQEAETPPRLTREQQEEFLRTARIIRRRGIPRGITNPIRATLTDGKLTHDAQIQSVDIWKVKSTTIRGTELNFTDSYKYNIVAYRLDKLLDLGMIPVSVNRKVGGRGSAVSWWIDDVQMDERTRIGRKIAVPDLEPWNCQMYCLRVFDQLIYNVDRTLENMMITNDWTVWMIDHTRAFRLHTKLKNEKNLVKCDRRLLAGLRELNDETLQKELRPYLTKAQIKALLKRRDRIVEFFDQAIAEKGEEEVLFDLPPRHDSPPGGSVRESSSEPETSAGGVTASRDGSAELPISE